MILLSFYIAEFDVPKEHGVNIFLICYKSTTSDDVISLRTAVLSKYSFAKILTLASDIISSFSTKPISLILGI